MSELDVRLFQLVYGGFVAPGGALGSWLWLMVGLSLVGGGWGALTLLPLYAASRTRRLAVHFGLTLGVNALVVVALKLLVGRPRPWLALGVEPLVLAGPTDFSFPSGHAAGSFCFAVFLARVLLAARPGRTSLAAASGLLVLAFGVALSRVALGVHFPADVLAGAILGAVIGSVGAALHLERADPAHVSLRGEPEARVSHLPRRAGSVRELASAHTLTDPTASGADADAEARAATGAQASTIARRRSG